MMQGGVRALALFLVVPTLAASAGVDSPELEAVDDVSEEGVRVFAGMLAAFLHRGHVSAEEVHCMSVSVRNATHLAFRASTDVAAALSPLLSPDGTLEEAAVATGHLLLLLPKLEASFSRLFDLFEGFLGPCVGDASRKALRVASRHMANLTYVAGSLQANGADIVRELADAGEAFEAGEFRQFGRAMGTACRKVLLSKASSQLPEGEPSLEAVANLTAGVLRGFFSKGFEIDIEWAAGREPVHADAIDLQSFRVRSAEVSSRVHLRIDVHRCVEANLKSLRPALLEMLEYFARQDLAREDELEEAMPDLVAAVTEDGPAALSGCGLGEEELETLGEAMAALGSLRVDLRLPRRSAARAALEGPVAELQRAADDWKALNWFGLGEDLGRMLLQLTVQAFPQEYALGPWGIARPEVEPGLVGGVSLLLFGLAAARGCRVLAGRGGPARRGDVEQGPGSAVE